MHSISTTTHHHDMLLIAGIRLSLGKPAHPHLENARVLLFQVARHRALCPLKGLYNVNHCRVECRLGYKCFRDRYGRYVGSLYGLKLIKSYDVRITIHVVK